LSRLIAQDEPLMSRTTVWIMRAIAEVQAGSDDLGDLIAALEAQAQEVTL
jgi:hypothetical protein